MKKLRCVGYVKPMDSMEILAEEKRILQIAVEEQINRIYSYARKNGFSVYKIYCEERVDEISAHKQLCEDAVHREFDVMLLDSLLCFGTAIHAAADFIENVMLRAGFRIVIIEADKIELSAYIRACHERLRIAHSQIKYLEKEYIPKPQNRKIRREGAVLHDLPWYEARQREIFEKMLTQDECFDELEAELKQCREIVKKLRS